MVSGDIILLDCKRIVVPGTAVANLLRRLHVGHCGHDKTLELTQSLFYWPDMGNDINTFTSECRECMIGIKIEISNSIKTRQIC